MSRPILNLADVELQPRPAAIAPTGPAAERFDSPEIAEFPDSGKFGVLAEFPSGADGKPQMFRYVGRQAQGVDYWEGE